MEQVQVMTKVKAWVNTLMEKVALVILMAKRVINVKEEGEMVQVQVMKKVKECQNAFMEESPPAMATCVSKGEEEGEWFRYK